MKPYYSAFSLYLGIILSLCFSVLNSQEDIDIIEAYEDYTNAPREVVYLHLNKSTYIKGESIGFTAYVLDKKDKKPALLTTNLYVSIEDENKTIIKNKLIRVDNGVASNLFEVDSLFNSGHYNIKAYTNWMRNFNEPNHFSESIRVIDPETEKYIEKSVVDNTIDAQFLPESGHLLNGVLNKVGVVIKDSQGYGVPNTKGEVIGKDNTVLTTFITNTLGIGSFSLLADVNDNYKVKINHANEDFNFSIGHSVEKNGIILSVKRLKDKLFASVITNEETLDIIKNKRYTLMMHNGNGYEIFDTYFTDDTVVNKIIEYSSIPTGTNILTLFNENEIPVAERLFFNYDGIDIIKTNRVSASDYVDSLTVKLNFKGINPEAFNNISISVLPQETASYNRNHNLISQTLLQPYIKGAIENGSYYFNTIDDKKRYDLDNLLVTQGWSSYDWNNMFLPEEFSYSFEQGIELKASINNQKHLNDVYLLHHSGNNPPQYKQTSDGNRSIIFDSTFPVDTNELYISRISSDDNLKPAQLYLQTFPNKIPRLETKSNPLLPKSSYSISEKLRVSQLSSFTLDNVQVLDEVIIESSVDKEMVRARKLSNHTSSTMKVPSENDKLTFLYLEDYLRANRVGVSLDSETGDVIFSNGRGPGGSILGGGGMLVYFDDALLAGTSFLNKFLLADVDYVEIDRNGFGGGARGANGILRIYSTTKSMFSNVNKATAQSYKIPLTFSKDKKFYTPKYQYYNDDFFIGYGTIDWKPKLAVDAEGNVSFKILKPQVPITLFIEGIANDGSFIFEEKSITLN
jgi:hypothetical protein